jgi:ketosteroid isomerase-like protein
MAVNREQRRENLVRATSLVRALAASLASLTASSLTSFLTPLVTTLAFSLSFCLSLSSAAQAESSTPAIKADFPSAIERSNSAHGDASTTAANQEDQEEIKSPKNYSHSSTLVAKSSCKIKCLDPHAYTQESADLVNLEQKIYLAYSDRDVDFISKHLADDCITFYEGDQKVVSGKQAALEDIKDWMNRDEKTDSPMLEIVIEHPYCNIKSGCDTVALTFTALKEIGGVHPGKFKSHVTDVFKKDGNVWLLLNHYRTSWRQIN